MRVLLIYILLHFASGLIAQTGQNPFDIQSKTVVTIPSDTLSTKPGATVTNSFDIDRPTVTSSSNTIKAISDVAPASASMIDSSTAAVTTDVQPELTSANPFEVSHIPIRRSQLKEKADAFKSKVHHNDSQESSSGIFLFWFILISAILIAVVINTKKNTIPALAKSILNENMLKYNYREENGGVAAQYIMLYMSFFINAACLAYLLVGKYMGMTGLTIFGYCAAAVVAIYTVKHISIAVMGVIFPIDPEASLYNFTIESFNIFLGLLLIPLNLVIAFGPKGLAIIFLYLAIAVVCLFLVLRTIRAFVLAAPYIQKHLFHFFLYLCAFELVPLMLLVKVVQ